MTRTTPLLRAALALSLTAWSCHPRPQPRPREKEKIAVMNLVAPDLSRGEVASVRDRLEVGVTQAVGTRLHVITKDSAAASIGGGDKLVACVESASCDAEIGGALGVDYFVSASVRRSAHGLELGVTILRTGRDVSLLRKDVKEFRSVRELLDGTSSHAEVVTRTALGGAEGAPAATVIGPELATLGVAVDVVPTAYVIPESLMSVVTGVLVRTGFRVTEDARDAAVLLKVKVDGTAQKGFWSVVRLGEERQTYHVTLELVAMSARDSRVLDQVTHEFTKLWEPASAYGRQPPKDELENAVARLRDGGKLHAYALELERERVRRQEQR